MSEQSNPERASSTRTYRMRRRRDAVGRTRERIVEATFTLHATVGPSRTSVSAIAAQAGVQRHTVYAHFPDLDTLFEACTDHGMRVTGMPDSTEWQSIDGPVERCRQGFAALAGWYRANERMLGNVLADVNPSAPPSATPDPFERRMDAMIASLLEPWDVPRDRQSVLNAVVRHAVAFTTWRSLAAGRLSDDQITGILTGLVQAVAEGSIAIEMSQMPSA
jgi:AcrR family transcriptional regulator